MRYYTLTVTSPDGKQAKQWSSFPNGKYDAKAHNISFNVPVSPFAVPSGAAAITIEGVQIDDLAHYNNFYKYTVELVAGMQGGLPLSNNQPPPSLIVKGWVAQGFGNWVGTEMSLTLFISSGKYSYKNPGNFVLQWKSGYTLASALQQCFTTAYPGMPQSIKISENLVLSHDKNGIYHSLVGLSTAVKGMTEGKFNGTSYPGVDISIQNGAIIAWDNTGTLDVTTLKYTDIIGQPAWVESDTMYIVVAMRADIRVGNYIKLPENISNLPGFVTTVPSFQNSYQKYDLTFKGVFYVKEVLHTGNFRSDSAQDWATVIKCVGTPA